MWKTINGTVSCTTVILSLLAYHQLNRLCSVYSQWSCQQIHHCSCPTGHGVWYCGPHCTSDCPSPCSTARSASCQTGRTRTISSASALMVWSRVHAYIIILYSQRIRGIAHYTLGYINLLTFIICYVTVQCSTGVSVLGGRRAASCLYHTLWPSGTVPDLRSWSHRFKFRPWLLCT